MRNKTFFFSLCLACLLVSACVSKEKYEELMATLQNVNVATIEEDDDETDLSGELACAGGACEIT